MQWIAAGGSQVGAPAVVSSRRKKKFTALTAALVGGRLVAAIAGTLVLIDAKPLTQAQQPIHASIMTGEAKSAMVAASVATEAMLAEPVGAFGNDRPALSPGRCGRSAPGLAV